MDVELLPEAEVHAGGMNFVEQDVHPPGSQERRPSDQHHHPHLIMKKNLPCINILSSWLFSTFNKSNLEFGEAVEVSVDVHHLDSFHGHGHHGDLRGDCQPVCDIIFKSLSNFNFKC